MNLLGYVALIFFSIIFFVGGYIFLHVNLYQIRNWTKTKAVVIKHEEGFDESASVYSAVVKFKIKNKDFIARTNFQSTFPRKIGKQITILYNPEDPETYTPYSFLQLYAAPLVFLMFGILPIGLVIYFSFVSE